MMTMTAIMATMRSMMTTTICSRLQPKMRQLVKDDIGDQGIIYTYDGFPHPSAFNRFMTTLSRSFTEDLTKPADEVLSVKSTKAQ